MLFCDLAGSTALSARLDPEDLRGVMAAYHRAVTEAVGKVVDQLPLDTVDRPWGRHDEYSLRWILLHMVEEYARHNGHADLIRESIDGTVGE